MSRPYEDWTTEALLNYEESLYDDEISGEEYPEFIWLIRDEILWELNLRDFGRTPSAFTATERGAK